MNGNTIGVRTEWTCAACGETERVHQVTLARAPVLDLPRGWRLENGRTYCAEHLPARVFRSVPRMDGHGQRLVLVNAGD